MKKHITIGIAGHVDHGKTALVRCLTGIDTDRMREEKQRGLSIESGIAPLKISSEIEIALVDVPGHTDFLKNTIRGLSNVDMVILVVSSDDGVMPQTLEHIQILEFFNVRAGFVVLSKVDLVDDETVELAELELREALEGTFLEGKPIIPFSAITKDGIEEIQYNIEKEIRELPGKDPHAPFRLWIDQVRSFTGFGTVVSGTILSGILKEDDTIVVLPSGIKTRARSIESHHRKVSMAFAGQRVGINLHKVPLKDVARGMLLSEPGAMSSTYLLNVSLHVLKDAIKPVKNRQRVKLYLGTSIINTLVVLMKKEQLAPGESGLAQFRLLKPAPALAGDNFVTCSLNIPTVIGGGTVLEIPKEKYRDAKAHAIIPYLRSIKEHNVKEFIEHVFKNNKGFLITPEALAQRTGFPLIDIHMEIDARIKTGELLYFDEMGVISKDIYDQFKYTIPKIVERQLKKNPLRLNIKVDEIKAQLPPSLDRVLIQKMCDELCDEGRLERRNGGFKSKTISSILSIEQERLVGICIEYATESDLVPFSADTIWKLHNKKFEKKDIQKMLIYLRDSKKLVRLNDGRFLSTEALERIKQRVKKVIMKNGIFTLKDLKPTLGYGRTVGVPILEYLDSIGFTRRNENGRVLINNDEMND